MTGLYLSAAVMALLSGMRAVVRLCRERSPIVAASALCMLASGTALLLAAVTQALLQARPAHLVTTWVSAILGLVATWAFLGIFAGVTGEKTRTAMHFVIPLAGAVLAGLVQAVLHIGGLAPGLPATAADLVLFAFYCPALAGIGALAWRCSQRIPVRYIDAGLRAVAVSAVAELVLILARSAEVTLPCAGVRRGSLG
jgi:hypothetical protein